MIESKQKLKAWWVVEFDVNCQQEELASWLMMQAGALGCELEPTADSNHTCVRSTFELNALPEGDVGKLSAALEEYGLSTSITSLRLKELQEEDWLAKWKVGFEPFPIGETLLICPAWLKDTLSCEQISKRQIILIEPGLAFGTGFHATTRFCLKSVEKYASAAKNILDVGTGSGILSIGAALLNSSAQNILALETDPGACAVARENFALNNVLARIDIIEGSTEQLEEKHHHKYDLILANLTYEDNAALLADYVLLSHASTHLVFAGILAEKLELMLAAVQEKDLVVIDKEIDDMWAGLVCSRR